MASRQHANKVDGITLTVSKVSEYESEIILTGNDSLPPSRKCLPLTLPPEYPTINIHPTSYKILH